MHTRTTILIPLLLACATTNNARSDSVIQTETIREELGVNPGGSLSLENVNGSIEVSVWDRDVVQIVVEKRAKGRSADDAKEILRESKVRIDKSGDDISVRMDRKSWNFGNNRELSVDYTVRLPGMFDAKLESVNGGVRAVGLNGSVSAETVNGGIDLTGIEGSFTAQSVNGDVEVELKESSGTNPLVAKTVNGDIKVSLPVGIGAHVTAKTVNGRIHTNLPIEVKGWIGKKLAGNVNGGGRPLHLETVNGSIRIRESSPR